MGGFVLLSIQEHRNLQSIKQRGTYRILCLGESTTQNQYPSYLEEILNKRNIGVRFSVIDKGKVGTNTIAILSQVETYLDRYHPDAVVTMVGNNDKGVKYYQDIPEFDSWLFRHCRVYRFGRIIYMHISKKIKLEGLYGLNRLKQLYRAHGKFSQAEDAFKKSIELNPKNDHAYVNLGQLYRTQGKFPQAEDLLKKTIELNPKNDFIYIGLEQLFQDQGKFPQAEDLLKKTIELNPKNDLAYSELGWIYRVQGKFSQAEDSCKKALKLNPKNGHAYSELGWIYRNQGKFSQAEDALKKALELNPKNDNAYVELGGFYRAQGKFPQAADLFKKAIEINPENGRIYGAMSSLYEEIGKPELAKEYAEKAYGLKFWHYNSVTINNYRRLKEILDKRGIRLVCVQYPMRDVEPLKKIFEEDKSIIFVDNKSVFKKALKQASFKEYFVDMFADDFGHCTPKGNRLLAQNIADVILREVFHRQ